MKEKIKFQFVPDACFYINLRTALPKDVWENVKIIVKKKANGKCMICGENSNRLECHEVWEYDKKKGIQSLKDVIAICPLCHGAIHYGFSSLKCSESQLEKIENHYMKVNECSYAEFRKNLSKANDTHIELNKVDDWITKIDKLKEILSNL